jgi:hypothetical protein
MGEPLTEAKSRRRTSEQRDGRMARWVRDVSDGERSGITCKCGIESKVDGRSQKRQKAVPQSPFFNHSSDVGFVGHLIGIVRSRDQSDRCIFGFKELTVKLPTENSFHFVIFHEATSGAHIFKNLPVPSVELIRRSRFILSDRRNNRPGFRKKY